MNRTLPRCLLDKYQLTGTVTFSVLFAVVFMNLYVPFSPTAWFALGSSSLFLYTLIFFLASLIFLIISRIILYKTRHIFEIKIWQYALWCVAEVVVICGIYLWMTVAIGEMPEDMTELRLFMKALLYGTVCLIVPYIISALYLSLNEKEKIIRLMNYSNVVSDEPAPGAGEQKITLFDIGGTLRFSVRRRNLYYIESDDNYIRVWYDDGLGNLKQYMVRCRLKTVEETFVNSTLIRCHRKYVVNAEHVRLLRKEGESFVLELDSGEIAPIPVTRTYEKAVLERFA